jgi:hypothetical protein
MHRSLMSIVAAGSIFGAAVTTSTNVEAGCRACWAGAATAGQLVTVYQYVPTYYGYFAPENYYCYARTYYSYAPAYYYGYAPAYYAPQRYVCTAARP